MDDIILSPISSATMENEVRIPTLLFLRLVLLYIRGTGMCERQYSPNIPSKHAFKKDSHPKNRNRFPYPGRFSPRFLPFSPTNSTHAPPLMFVHVSPDGAFGPRPLSFCGAHSGRSCCSPERDVQLASHFATLGLASPAAQPCADIVKKILCAVSPQPPTLHLSFS